VERKQSVVTPERSDEATSLTWLQELGFAVLWTRFMPEGDGGHVLVCARRPSP
jgi:hypothetical protein